MRLNLPIVDLLSDCRNILIAGGGGGFDVFVGLPIYFTLRDLGLNVHLANYSFVDLGLASVVSQTQTLVKDELICTLGQVEIPLEYMPEAYLAQWFQEVRGESVPIWMFANTGAAPLRAAYQALAEHLNLDAVILVDGGVDSLMRGDENGAGTLVEDTLSLIAVRALDLKVKIQACIGFGTEVEEAVCHYNALENMAGLIKAGAYLGSCGLTPQMEAFKLFEAACRYVWEQPGHHQSHISTRIVPAAQGEFGNYHMYEYSRRRTHVLISPLMSLYWFFDANIVAERNLLIDVLAETHDKAEAFRVTTRWVNAQQTIRPVRKLPY
ncbi:MAG: DUF1152 domain-containing protein [Chloroflexi bacterium]|nr:DUF1152 domain-containing protein [Chloroflexota bacterium]